jgi:hypothetical protein
LSSRLERWCRTLAVSRQHDAITDYALVRRNNVDLCTLYEAMDEAKRRIAAEIALRQTIGRSA